MVPRTMSLGTQEIDFLRDTLHAQQELLQKLYNELDVERESSSIAADEALSMILRLQGERAAMEMEANQYKRIAEEKIGHAQETVEIFQELIYQKEMHIASLEFQVQAYKFKLASMGCEDLAACDMQYPENILSRRNGAVAEPSTRSSIRRGTSLPPPLNDAWSRRASSEVSKSAASSPKEESKSGESSSRREHTPPVDFTSYLEEIKKLDERVKGFSCFNDSSNPEDAYDSSGPCSSELPVSTSAMPNPSPDTSPTTPFFHDCPGDGQACGDSQCSTSIQDIFEVPQCSDDDQSRPSVKKAKPDLSLEKETRIANLESAWEEIWKSSNKEKIDWEKQPLLTPGSNRSSPKPKEFQEKSDCEKKPFPSPRSHAGSPKPKDEKTDKQMLIKHPTYGVADFELQQFNRRLKQLEDNRFVTRGREINCEMGDEELRLLKEIKDKLDSMQADITNWRPKKPPSPEDRSFGCFKEAMLCFLP